MVRARQDASTPGGPNPPAALRPVLRFTRLPTRALRTVRDVLDRDQGFRAHVAEGASEDSVGRASWLYLVRPDGWAEELELLRDAASEEADEVTASRQEQTAERRLAQVEESLDRVRAELRAAQEQVVDTEQALAAERAARLGLDADRAALEARVRELDDERGRAVRSLKEVEVRAATRLEQLRAEQSRLTEAEARLARLEAEAVERRTRESSTPGRPAPGSVVEDRAHDARPDDTATPEAGQAAVTSEPSPWAGADPAAVASAVQAAAAAAEMLGVALTEAARALTPDPTATGAVMAPGLPGSSAANGGADALDAPAGDADVDLTRGPRPPRRTPIRLQRGVHDGSVEGVEQLLTTPDVVAIVDGYNVSMEAWPTLDHGAQRSSLIAMLGVLQARTGAAFHVVFDGDDDGRRPSVGAPLPVRVHFSHAEVEADDVVLDMVARLPTDRPVVVVSSDRRVQDGARRLGANVVRSCELLSVSRS